MNFLSCKSLPLDNGSQQSWLNWNQCGLNKIIMHFQLSNWINSCLLPVSMNWWIGDAPFFYSLMIASLALQLLPHFSMGLASSVSFLSLEVSCKALFSCNPKKKRVHAIFQWKSCTVCIKETHSVSVKGLGSAFFLSSTSLLFWFKSSFDLPPPPIAVVINTFSVLWSSWVEA